MSRIRKSLLSAEIVNASADIVDKTPTSQRDLKSVQAAFNEWRVESGRGLAEISRILAFSVG